MNTLMILVLLIYVCLVFTGFYYTFKSRNSMFYYQRANLIQKAIDFYTASCFVGLFGLVLLITKVLQMQ